MFIWRECAPDTSGRTTETGKMRRQRGERDRKSWREKRKDWQRWLRREERPNYSYTEKDN